jgi:serine protease Do
MEKKYSPFWVSLITSMVVAIIWYFVLFSLLRADITDTQSSVVRLLQEQQASLEKTFDTSLSLIQEAIVANIDQATKSVVSIVATRNVQYYLLTPGQRPTLAQSEAKVGGGSGIVVSKSGYILTNQHVVSDPNASYTIITHDARTYPVTKVWFDPVLDIAVLRIDDSSATFSEHTQEAEFVSLGENISIGQFAFAIGNVLTELQNSVTFGIVSAKNRELQMQGDNMYVGLIQTDTPINPWNSGGPLLNIYGKVIGINTAINQFAQWVWFALPVTQEFIAATIQSIQAYATIVRPYVGIMYKDITVALQKEMNIAVVDHGIYVTDVVASSPAMAAGIQWGDIILAINDVAIDSTLPFLYQLYTYKPGDTLRLHILRSGDRVYRDVILGTNQ